MSRRLNGVGMKHHAAFPADLADFPDRQHRADLIVGVHDTDQAGVLPDGVGHLLGRHGAGLADRQKLHLKALFFQPLQRVQDGVMLKGGGNDVFFPFSLADFRRRDQGLVVGLTAAGSKIDLPGLTSETGCDAFPRTLQRLSRLLTGRMQAGRIAVNAIHIGQHGLNGRAAHFCGRRIVRVDHH